MVLVGGLSPGDGSVLYARAVGVADRSTGRAHAVGDVWTWASVSKQVTAVLVLQEVARGRLALDAPVARYLPGWRSPSARRVTLRQLLQHTSGLPNPDDTPADADSVPVFYHRAVAPGRTPDAAATRGVCAGRPKRAPGARFEYNNCDYLVLGAVLERVTGRPWAALVRGRIAAPLGLRSVGVYAGPGGGFRAPAVGYVDSARRAPALVTSAFGAAGAMYGTPGDLLAFDRALARHQLLPAAWTDTLWAGAPRLGYVAFGAWGFAAPLAGCAGPVRLVERRGEIGGIEARNVIAPALGRAVVVFTNRADVEFGEVWQGRGLTYALLGAALCPPAAPPGSR